MPAFALFNNFRQEQGHVGDQLRHHRQRRGCGCRAHIHEVRSGPRTNERQHERQGATRSRLSNDRGGEIGCWSRKFPGGEKV